MAYFGVVLGLKLQNPQLLILVNKIECEVIKKNVPGTTVVQVVHV